jgi:hypothetical protein
VFCLVKAPGKAPVAQSATAITLALIMRFPGPFHLFSSAGVWIGFCEGSNLFNTDAVWCGWFPWVGSFNAVKPDGSYLGTVVGARFYYFEHRQQLRIRKLIEYPKTPALPSRPAPLAPRELFDGATDINLKSVVVLPLPAMARIARV